MHFVVLVVIVAAVYGRDLSDAGYYPAHPNGRYDRQHINSPPPEETVRRYEKNDSSRGNYENYRPVDLNYNRHVVNNEYKRELLNNGRNGKRHNFPNTDRHSRDIIREMDINLAFERDLTYPRDDGDMVFRNDDEDDHNKSKPPVRPNNNNNNSYSTDATYIGIVSFLNNLDINNTNNNVNSDKQIKTQPNDVNNVKTELYSDSVSNTDQEPSKTTIADKVTPNPLSKDSVVTEEKWVWGDDSNTDAETTTDMTTQGELDDRTSFAGDQCASGMARIQGKCVKKE